MSEQPQHDSNLSHRELTLLVSAIDVALGMSTRVDAPTKELWALRDRMSWWPDTPNEREPRWR